MSDSDSDVEYSMEWYARKYCKARRETLVGIQPTDEVCERFKLIPMETKKAAVHRMKICTFWFPILLQPERADDKAFVWAVDIGLRHSSHDLTLENLDVLHLVERILNTLEKAAIKKGQVRETMLISSMFNVRSPKVFYEAMIYVEQMGDLSMRDLLEVFHCPDRCSTVFSMIFTEFGKFIQAMGTNLESTLRCLNHKPSDHQLEKSEEMKMKGNKHFKVEEYDDALKFYTEAIRYHPDNHFLYGNRALCYLRCKRFLKAVGDGKCATLIKPQWAKGHYRYAEALFYVGRPQQAFVANSIGQELCKGDQDGIKDLQQQEQKFINELIDANVLTPGCPRTSPCRSRAKGEAPHTGEAQKNKSTPKISELKADRQSGKTDRPAQKPGSTKDPKPSRSESSSKNTRVESNNGTKKKAKTKNAPAEEKNETDSRAAVCKELRSLVQDAHAALEDRRSHNAEQTFGRALLLLETTTAKDLGLSTVDVLVLMFGRVLALADIAQHEEVAEAQKVLEKMNSFNDRTFQCLLYYADGTLALKTNRFSKALGQFLSSLQMVKNQITPGKLNWPLTKEVVKETENLKDILESAIESCRFPPPPDAVCRWEKCGSARHEIYFTDPDFKGFIQMLCCQSCTVEFHVACWKSLKMTVHNDKKEKDFLHEPCFTPDCFGLICNIKIYTATGLVKCKFEADIQKPQTQKKPRVNQKCTSQKKLKSKEERKVKRKRHKQSSLEKKSFSDEILKQDDGSAPQIQQKAWLHYGDRVLLQISQKLDLIREEKSLQVSALTGSLRPWLELDSSRGNRLAARLLNWQQEQLHTTGQVLELLLERKNRVWARVLVHLLSGCTNMNPKLSSWASQLDAAGLEAARSFVERHGEQLEQLDPAVLLNFSPLQDLILEKLGARPELFSSMGLTVTEYLKQAPPHHRRLFIWTLEEHRQDYVSCHTLLDEYFDMMDGHCLVLKKSDENNSPMKNKNRGRRKRRKEPMPTYVFRERRDRTPTDEWSQDFIEEDSLSFLHPVDPFSVPSHLREQVADFENQFNRSRLRTHFRSILDNNPDPTKESLYDYFEQILDEHGPLLAEDRLLVGELCYFPPVALQTIEESGGFEAFLLGSLRFIKMGQCIGLAKHAVALQHSVQGARLDDLDEIAGPDDEAFPMIADAEFTGCLDGYPPAGVRHVLPNPYASEFYPAGTSGYAPWSHGDDQHLVYYSPYLQEEAELYPCDLPQSIPKAECSRADAAVQTSQETMRSVAVNTEVYEPFEKYQGDLIKKEKSNEKLERHIREMTDGSGSAHLATREDIASLEGDIQRIHANIQVTNKELLLFQQKLEEEMKKDQKEKKANQEALALLKQEIGELQEEKGSLTRSVRQKKSRYEAKLSEFLDLSNQSATEKMSLEDEIQRCRALLAAVAPRSLSAQLLAVEGRRDQLLYDLRRELADSKAVLAKLDDALLRFQNEELERKRLSCRAAIEELKKKISKTEQEFQEQIDQVKNGSRANASPPVGVQSAAAAAPLSAAAAAPASRSTPPLPPAASLQHAAAKVPPQKPPGRDPPSHGTVFEKAMESLVTMFPDYPRPHLMKFIQEVRSTSGGSLSGRDLQNVVAEVTLLILDHQERLLAARSNAAAQRSPAVTPPLPAWQPVASQRPAKALNMEDPCIICHEEMSEDDTYVLECRHGFHDECIRSWLKEQSTCPTCRNHALLNDDFPRLSGRRRL